MDFDEVIARRRSIRTYSDRDVPEALIMKLLAYGHAAPSAGNLHPWEFIVVRDPVNRRRIVDTTFRGNDFNGTCLLYTSPSPRDLSTSRMPSSA